MTVKKIELKRNLTEITAESQIAPDYSLADIIFYYNGNFSFNRGDVLFIHKKIKKNEYIPSQDKFSKDNAKGIKYIASICDNDITIINKAKPGIREILKQKLNANINKLFNKDTAAMIKALFTGNRSSVSKYVTFKFRDAGALHLLAASGLHVGIAAGLPFFLLFFNLRKKTVLCYSLVFVLIYLFITDMPISLIRASLMFFLLSIQIFLHRKSSAFNTLMLTGSIIVLIYPWEIFNLGFQLSFSATMGIILFYKSYIKTLKKYPSYIRESIAISLAAQVFTIPLILLHLHQINTISILSNIVLIPLVTVFMYISLTSFFTSILIPSYAHIISSITDFGYNVLLKTACFFADFNYNFYLNDNIAPVLVLLSLTLIPIIPIRIKSKMKAVPVFLSLILCTIYLEIPADDRAEEIVFLSGKSSIIVDKQDITKLTLDIQDIKDIDILLNELKNTVKNVNILIIKNGSFPNQLACKKICNDFIIDECCFSVLPDISNSFKTLLCFLETDNIKITVPAE